MPCKKSKLEKRKHKRIRMKRCCKTHEWEKGIDERFCDISETGCKIKTNLVYDPGEIIGIMIDRCYYYGIVIREDYDGYGIEFLK